MFGIKLDLYGKKNIFHWKSMFLDCYKETIKAIRRSAHSLKVCFRCNKLQVRSMLAVLRHPTEIALQLKKIYHIQAGAFLLNDVIN